VGRPLVQLWMVTLCFVTLLISRRAVRASGGVLQKLLPEEEEENTFFKVGFLEIGVGFQTLNTIRSEHISLDQKMSENLYDQTTMKR